MKRSVTNISFENVSKKHAEERNYINKIFCTGSSSSLPKCRAAVGYLYHDLHNKNLSKTLINDFPEFLRCFGNKYSKNPKRLSNVLDEFVKKYPEFVIECKKQHLDDPQIINQHAASDFSLIEDRLCSICFKETSPSVVKDIICSKEAMKLQIHDFVVYQINNGESLAYVHDELLKISFNVCNSIRKSSPSSSSEINAIYDYKVKNDDLKNKISILKKTNTEIIKKVNLNLTAYNKNLQDNAAFVQYYLNISQSELKVFDKKVFCRPREDDTLEQIAKRYPKLSNISPVSMHNDVFKDFCTFIDNHNEEPNFGSLGAKYNLSGKSNGNSRTLQTRFAQSICYNMLVEARNLFPEKYTVAEKIVINEVQKRKGFEKFPLIENASFPRLPSKSEADKNVHSLISQGKLLLGDPQIPETIKTYDYKTHKDMVVHSCSRKNSIQTIKEFLLNEHVEHAYLRARKADYYDNLSRSEAIETLSRYGVYFDTDFRGQTAALPTGDLRQLVKITETTRHFLIWYDHSTIGGISYILFNFQYIFSPAVYYNNKLSERELQYIIEKPILYFIGVSPSTTKSEESYSQMRLEDIQLAAAPITRDGITYHDVYRFTTGDHPVRCVEAGNNKSGYWRIPGCTIKLEGKIIPFNIMVSSEHITIEKQREFVNKGGYFENTSNFGKSLQDQDPRVIGLSYKTKAEAEPVLKEELKGVRHQHLLLMHNPMTPLSDLNLEKLEISPAEPLHDLKAVSKAILTNIPGKLKSNTHVLKITKEIVSKQGDEKFILKELNNAETIFTFVIQITSHLEYRLFPEGVRLPCVNCGPLFHVKDTRKCEKCLIVGIYRALCEIHVYGYQDISKKTPYDILRFYNLVFILYKFILDFQSIYPDVNTTDICSNVYFVNVIRYLPVMYELHDLLSLNAGRHEGDFRVFKNVVGNYSNMHHFSDKFLLHVLKKVEIKKFYKVAGLIPGKNYKDHKTSTISKMISQFFIVSPKPEIGFHISLFSNGESENTLTHLERISTFIVSNVKCGLKFMNYNHSSAIISFPYFETLVYPPFPIYSILNSNIEHILLTKHRCFQEITKNCFQNGVLNVSKFIQFMLGDNNIQTVSANQDYTSSISLEPSLIG